MKIVDPGASGPHLLQLLRLSMQLLSLLPKRLSGQRSEPFAVVQAQSLPKNFGFQLSNWINLNYSLDRTTCLIN